MNRQRRTVLKSFAAGAATFLGAALVKPNQLWAAWPQAAFDAKTVDEAMQARYAGESAEESGSITINAPDIAENGRVVPVSISTDLPNVESIDLYAPENPVPLVASYELTPETLPEITTRIKMAKTQNLIAVVKSDGKLYSAKKEVKITIGGCGG